MFELKKYCYKLYKMVKNKLVKKIPKLDVPTIGIIVVSVAIIIVLVSNLYKKVKREGFKLLNIGPGDLKTDGIAKTQYSFPANQRLDVINKMISIVKDTKTKESQDFINWTLANSLPKGSIILWYGKESTIPKGWAICDGRVIGKHRTWNLGDRFMVGVGSSSKNGEVKGQSFYHDYKGMLSNFVRVTLDTDNLPNHNHLGTVTLNDKGHSHYCRATDNGDLKVHGSAEDFNWDYGSGTILWSGKHSKQYEIKKNHTHTYTTPSATPSISFSVSVNHFGNNTPFNIHYKPPLGYIGVYYIEKIV